MCVQMIQFPKVPGLQTIVDMLETTPKLIDKKSIYKKSGLKTHNFLNPFFERNLDPRREWPTCLTSQRNGDISGKHYSITQQTWHPTWCKGEWGAFLSLSLSLSIYIYIWWNLFGIVLATGVGE